MGLRDRLTTRSGVPAEVAGALGLSRGEQVLAWASEGADGVTVVTTNHALYAVEPGSEVRLARPWHLVDGGVWDHDTFLLTVTWVDGAAPSQFRLTGPGRVPETVRERVQASVVLADEVSLPGRRRARVVVRQDLASGALLDQVVLGRGVRGDEPGVQEATDAALREVREQVGLD